MSTKNQNILLVEDDLLLSEVLKYELSKKRFQVEVRKNASSALEFLRSRDDLPDLIVLDYFLGKSQPTGIELCRKISGAYEIPIVMLTSNDDQQSVVSCLDAGASQYIIKPYKIEELVARFRAAMRIKKIGNSRTEARTIKAHDLEIDPIAKVLSIGNLCTKLTEKESAVASLLVSSFEDVILREEISSVVYEKQLDPTSRAIDVVIGRLRKKLSSLSDKYEISVSRSKGYLLQMALPRDNLTS